MVVVVGGGWGCTYLVGVSNEVEGYAELQQHRIHRHQVTHRHRALVARESVRAREQSRAGQSGSKQGGINIIKN